jgi:O-antigen/teichoic acid export membrane protein
MNWNDGSATPASSAATVDTNASAAAPMGQQRSFKKLFMTLFLLGLRASGLLSKFLLTLYIAKEMSLADLGLYGLIAVGATVVPSVLGLGLNGPAGRSCVGVSTADGIRIATTRVGITLMLHCLLSPLAIIALDLWLPATDHQLVFLVTAILILENLSSDLNTLLMARFRTNFAAVLLFLRSGAWPLLFIADAWFTPALRTVYGIMGFWFASLLLVMAILAIHAAIRGYYRLLKFDKLLAKELIARGRNFYVAEIGNAGTLYSDRFLVSTFLGLEATGIYTFFWSLTNAVNNLIFTAVTNPLAPRIIAVVQSGNRPQVKAACAKMFREIILWAVGMAVILATLLPLVLRYLNNAKLDQHQWVFALMLCATVLRTVSEAADVVLYAHHQDRKIAWISILAMLVSAALISSLAPFQGLIGVAAAMLGASLFVISLRGVTARKLLR